MITYAASCLEGAVGIDGPAVGSNILQGSAVASSAVAEGVATDGVECRWDGIQVIVGVAVRLGQGC